MPRVLVSGDLNLPQSQSGSITPGPRFNVFNSAAPMLEHASRQVDAITRSYQAKAQDEHNRQQGLNYSLAQAELNTRGITLQDTQQEKLNTLLRDPNLTPQKLEGFQQSYREELATQSEEMAATIAEEYNLDVERAAALGLNASSRLPGMFAQGNAAQQQLEVAMIVQQGEKMKPAWENTIADDPYALEAIIEEADSFYDSLGLNVGVASEEKRIIQNQLSTVAAKSQINTNPRAFLAEQDRYKKTFIHEEHRLAFVEAAQNKIKREDKLAQMDMDRAVGQELELTRAALVNQSTAAATIALRAPVEDRPAVYQNTMNGFRKAELAQYNRPHEIELVNMWYDRQILEMRHADEAMKATVRAGDEGMAARDIASSVYITSGSSPYLSEAAQRNAEALLRDNSMWNDLDELERQKIQSTLRDANGPITLTGWGKNNPNGLLNAVTNPQQGTDDLVALFPHVDSKTVVDYLNSPSSAKLAEQWLVAQQLEAKRVSILSDKYTPDPSDKDDAFILDNDYAGSVTAPPGTADYTAQNIEFTRQYRGVAPAQERKLLGELNGKDAKVATSAATALMEMSHRNADAFDAAHIPVDSLIKAQRIVEAGSEEAVKQILAEQPLSVADREDLKTYWNTAVLGDTDGKEYKRLENGYVKVRNEFWDDFEEDLSTRAIERGRARFNREVGDIITSSRATLDQAMDIVSNRAKYWVGEDYLTDGTPHTVWDPPGLHPSVRGLNEYQLGDKTPSLLMRETAVDDIAKRVVFDMKPDQWPVPMREEWSKNKSNYIDTAQSQLARETIQRSERGEKRSPPDKGAAVAVAQSNFAKDWFEENLRVLPMDTLPSTAQPTYLIAYHDSEQFGNQPLLTWADKSKGTQTGLKWTFSYNQSPEYKNYQQRLIDIDADKAHEMLKARKIQRTVDIEKRRGISIGAKSNQ